MNHIIKPLAALLAGSMMLSSCSTMFNSGSQTIIARSTDGSEGIKVEVSSSTGSYPTKLPATLAAEPSHSGVSIRVVDQCYDSTIVTVNQSITPSFWANFLWISGFWLGMGVDAVTGKLWKYDNNVAVPVNKKAECENNTKAS
ncbi:MAG: hypothetical protein HQM11_03030 [SAR324 cluster bacterium]|nr:hypothetical protein [SAR324 cluster bacterium]